MLVLGITLDLRWFLQFVVTVFLISLGLLHLVKNTASKYFEVDANFDATTAIGGGPRSGAGPFGKAMAEAHIEDSLCVVCSVNGSKQCSRCKSVRYCSTKCQSEHWKTHRAKCRVLQPSSKENSREIRLFIENGTTKPIKQIKKVLFPYDEFINLYKWGRPGFSPCGLINCGNSCYANVVLQCLSSTKPLVAYLLSRGHRKECRRNDWCFLCELQGHLERASNSLQPFSPINILSRLPNIGGNLGYGRQEDAHEFMRFAIDTMQSVCLDEFGGEKAVHSSSQETTLIQHIFGGQLQSQVICTNCSKVSSQYENMMDLTVEIHGNAASLEECLQQFTDREWLHGDNMYRCDGCNDYVKAWKRLTVWQAPNILTIALKRFQSGRFGKLNKKVNFPETLNLSPYMSEEGDGTDVYKLYGVVVHVDMLNASFFGHYICYTKDFSGNWYRNDDCKIASVGLDEVLSQGAYMLLYSRVSPRPPCPTAPETTSVEEKHQKEINKSVMPCSSKEEAQLISSSDPGGSSTCEQLLIVEEEPMDIDVVSNGVSSSSSSSTLVLGGVSNGDIYINVSSSMGGQNPRGVVGQDVEEAVDGNEVPLMTTEKQIIISSENGPFVADDNHSSDEHVDVFMTNRGGGVAMAVGSSSSSIIPKDNNGVVEYCKGIGGGIIGSQLAAAGQPNAAENSFGGNHECKDRQSPFPIC